MSQFTDSLLSIVVILVFGVGIYLKIAKKTLKEFVKGIIELFKSTSEEVSK